MATKTFLEELGESLEQWPAEGPVTRAEVSVWAWWFLVMVNVLEEQGLFYRGASIRYQGWSTLLVVKVARGNTPLIAFITERNTTDCMRVFKRLLDENRAEWREDKFG